MQIFVRIFAQRTCTLEVEKYDTVLSLKCRIQEKTGIYHSKQRLILHGKQIDGDHKTLELVGIQKEDTLHLVGRLRAGHIEDHIHSSNFYPLEHIKIRPDHIFTFRLENNLVFLDIRSSVTITVDNNTVFPTETSLHYDNENNLILTCRAVELLPYGTKGTVTLHGDAFKGMHSTIHSSYFYIQDKPTDCFSLHKTTTPYI